MKMAHSTATRGRMPDITARAWAVARRLEIFSTAEIETELSLARRAAQDVISAWLAAGKVRLRSGGTGPHRAVYQVSEEYRPRDRATIVAQQLWTAACGLKVFGPLDLKAHCRADLQIEEREASAYCQTLLRAGYLLVHRSAVPGAREATYRLIRNSGPRAPREKRVQTVWDPNEAGYVYIAGLGRIGGAL